MLQKEYDLVVIGSGPAGEKAAAQAAYFDQNVIVIDRAPAPGGAAVHTGTLPSKTLRETAIYLSGHRSRQLYGLSVELQADATVPVLMQRKDHIIEVEVRRIHGNLERHGIDYLKGHARFADPHTVVVETDDGERRVQGRFFLVATGSTPRQPEGIDFADDQIHDSDEILTITRLPRSMIVLGGGVIGCEYACMFAALGVQITLVDARDEILPFLDHEVVDHLRDALEHLGIEVLLGTRWGHIHREGDEVVVDIPGAEALVAQDCLFAAGRVGATSNLGLE
ncbi:MAG: FAD-dependent oxidoreductase, partial [Deltaproteobacteria bacterium]|nr:FAD-dependent oxidoreductase [Deltaproteobacteria bacterium]